MGWKLNKRIGLYFMSAAVLLAGLGSSITIYLRAGQTVDSALLEEFEYSKRYQHDLELYGGKANVIASEITNWFNGLWHGKSLAIMVAVISILVASGLFLAARISPSGPKSSVDKN
ncbi:MAG TPA: hypothetical protein VF799_00370 [Geobacteraceae bacterium]